MGVEGLVGGWLSPTMLAVVAGLLLCACVWLLMPAILVGLGLLGDANDGV